MVSEQNNASSSDGRINNGCTKAEYCTRCPLGHTSNTPDLVFVLHHEYFKFFFSSLMFSCLQTALSKAMLYFSPQDMLYLATCYISPVSLQKYFAYLIESKLSSLTLQKGRP